MSWSSKWSRYQDHAWFGLMYHGGIWGSLGGYARLQCKIQPAYQSRKRRLTVVLERVELCKVCCRQGSRLFICCLHIARRHPQALQALQRGKILVTWSVVSRPASLLSPTCSKIPSPAQHRLEFFPAAVALASYVEPNPPWPFRHLRHACAVNFSSGSLRWRYFFLHNVT